MSTDRPSMNCLKCLIAQTMAVSSLSKAERLFSAAGNFLDIKAIGLRVLLLTCSSDAPEAMSDASHVMMNFPNDVGKVRVHALRRACLAASKALVCSAFHLKFSCSSWRSIANVFPMLGRKRRKWLTKPMKLLTARFDLGTGNSAIALTFSGSVCSPLTHTMWPRNWTVGWKKELFS